MAERNLNWVYALGLVVLSVTGVIIVASGDKCPNLSHSDLIDITGNLKKDNLHAMAWTCEDSAAVLAVSDTCPYELTILTPDEVRVKCGWWITSQLEIREEYFQTYGKDEWIRNNRKTTKTEIEVLNNTSDFKIDLKRITEYYRGRSGTDSSVTDIVTVMPGLVKISNKIEELGGRKNPSKRKIKYKVVKNTDKSTIHWDDPSFRGKEGDEYIYEGTGNFIIDPIIEIGDFVEIKECRNETFYRTEVSFDKNCSDIINENGTEDEVCVFFPVYTNVSEVQCINDGRIEVNIGGILVENISYSNYFCSKYNETSVCCDSTIDGNGDGICSSGETRKYLIFNLLNYTVETINSDIERTFIEEKSDYSKIEIKDKSVVIE